MKTTHKSAEKSWQNLQLITSLALIFSLVAFLVLWWLGVVALALAVWGLWLSFRPQSKLHASAKGLRLCNSAAGVVSLFCLVAGIS